MTHRNGFTLIELLIVIALVAILATFAGPAFWSFIQNTRTTTQANAFVTAINVARSEAGRRGAAVEFCASDDGATCGGHGDWSSNWIVKEEGGAGEVIRVWNDLPASLSLTESGDDSTVTFNARGESAGADSYDFTLWFDGCSGDQTRAIDISAAGRPSVTRNGDECS